MYHGPSSDNHTLYTYYLPHSEIAKYINSFINILHISNCMFWINCPVAPLTILPLYTPMGFPLLISAETPTWVSGALIPGGPRGWPSLSDRCSFPGPSTSFWFLPVTRYCSLARLDNQSLGKWGNSAFTCGHRLTLWQPSPQKQHTGPPVGGRSLLRVSSSFDWYNRSTNTPSLLPSSLFPTLGSCLSVSTTTFLRSRVRESLGWFPTSESQFTMETLFESEWLSHTRQLSTISPIGVSCANPSNCRRSAHCPWLAMNLSLISYHRIPSLLLHIPKPLNHKYS